MILSHKGTGMIKDGKRFRRITKEMKVEMAGSCAKPMEPTANVRSALAWSQTVKGKGGVHEDMMEKNAYCWRALVSTGRVRQE